MLTLYIANTFEEAVFNTDVLNIQEEIHYYLQKNESQYPCENLKLITGLSVYLTEKVFIKTEVYLLKELSEKMITYTQENQHKQLNVFFINLYNFCEKALSKNKSIVAIGD